MFEILTQLFGPRPPRDLKLREFLEELLCHHCLDQKHPERRLEGDWTEMELGRLMRASAPCESPIEQWLLYALRFMPIWHVEDISISADPYIPTKAAAPSITIYPQCPFGPFRADFLIVGKHRTGRETLFDIEADGRDFHDAVRDARRDRYFKSKGVFVLRFTGSEIVNDAPGCASRVGFSLFDAMA